LNSSYFKRKTNNRDKNIDEGLCPKTIEERAQNKASMNIDVKKSKLEFSNSKWHVPHMA